MNGIINSLKLSIDANYVNVLLLLGRIPKGAQV